MRLTGHRPRAGRAALLAAAAFTVAGPAFAQDLKAVPRERTLISQGWDFHNQVPSVDNFNPYAGVLLHARNSLHYTVYEHLFYTNHNTNELIPWIGESFTYNDDFTALTVKLRDGVKWSDGKPLTADDVAFTFAMLKSEAPGMLFSSAIDSWVESATATDPLTVEIKLKKSGPRWAKDFLATGQSTRFVVVPKHIWDGKDASEFANFDIAGGLPVGTGPYKLVAASASGLTYDLRDSWWAVETGLVPAMPKVERILYVPGTAEAMPQLFASNQIDMGRSIQAGAYDAIRFQNPALISWNKEGPVWGAPDGCTFALRFNTQVAPFDQAAVRQAFNYALDRAEISDLAYEGSMPPALLPFSSYQGMLDYVAAMADLDPSQLDNQSVDKVAELLTAAGFKKGDNGLWANADGSPWQMEVTVSQGDPIGPVLGQQLKSAGFDVIIQVQQEAAKVEAYTSGNYQMDIGPHCGSLYDPWQTLEHYHSKYAAPKGEAVKNARAMTRYANPELDVILDKLEAMQPSPDDAVYMDLVKQATAIFMRDLPEISLAEELHTLVFNSTYWKGWPSAEDPYIAPYLPWEGFARVIHRLEPAK